MTEGTKVKYLIVSKNEGLTHIVRVWENKLSSNPAYAAQLSCSAISRSTSLQDLHKYEQTKFDDLADVRAFVKTSKICKHCEVTLEYPK